MVKSIGIPGFFRPDQRVGGVYSVFENLLRGFAELLDEGPRDNPFELTVFHGAVVPQHQDSRFHWRAVPSRLSRFVAEAHVAAGTGRQLDALLFLNYHTPLVTRSGRVVTIVHDLQYAHMPQFYNPAKRLWLRLCHEITLRKCHRIAAISGVVKEDMLRLYGDKWLHRIEVVWNPVTIDRFASDVDYNITRGRPYIMCVSVDRPQKNLYRLIKAFDLVRKKFPDYCLVVAGQLRSLRRQRRERAAAVGQTMPAATDLVEELQLGEHVHVTGFISDAQLGALYRGATLCVLPSLFEGFGMPAIESLAMAKPTLVSGLPVLREITFNSAQYIEDPTDVNAMAENLAAMLERPADFRPAPELVGRVRRAFSPRNVAERYLSLLTD